MTLMSETDSSAYNYLVVGATSGIARALVRLLAADQRPDGRSFGFILCGRQLPELERLAADLRTRAPVGTRVAVRQLNAEHLDTIPGVFADCTSALPGGISELLLCHGWLPHAEASKREPAVMRQLIDVNYSSAVLLLELATQHFESHRRGAIVAISSVAGDRGRQSNYPYGATKAALSTYLQGLRNRLHPAGIPVLTVKPGFTDTAMTWGRVRSDSPLNAAPERVARSILRAMRRRRNVIYTPWFWRLILLVFRSVPEAIFKRLKT